MKMEGWHNRVLGQVVLVDSTGASCQKRDLIWPFHNFEEFTPSTTPLAHKLGLNQGGLPCGRLRKTANWLGTRNDIVDGDLQLRVSENLDLLFLLCDGSSLSNDKGGIGKCGRGDAWDIFHIFSEKLLEDSQKDNANKFIAFDTWIWLRFEIRLPPFDSLLQPWKSFGSESERQLERRRLLSPSQTVLVFCF